MTETAERVFQPLCRLDSLTPHQPAGVLTPAGERLCVVSDGEQAIAFADVCPHRGHPLSEGECAGGVLRCALHGWEFSLDDGSAVSPASPFGLDLRATRVTEDGMLEVEDA